MKKITLLIVLFFSFAGFSQILAPFEGFESGTFPPNTPAAWAVFDNGVNAPGINAKNWAPITTTALVNEGLISAYMDGRQNIGAGNTARDFLASPAVTVPVNGQMKFFTRTNNPSPVGTNLQIRVKLVSAGAQNDPTGYDIIQEWNNGSVPQMTVPFNVYQEKVIDFNLTPQYQNVPIYIAFCLENLQTGTTTTANRWLVDQVRLVTQCLNPAATSLTVTSLLSSSATLGWASTIGSAGYEIENQPAAVAFTGVANGTSTTNSFAQTGLTGSTCYHFRVRSNCGNGNFGDWTGDFAYCTTATPPVCGGIFTDSGGANANYSSNENTTTTILPVPSTNQVTVTFTSFNTQNLSDTLKIYDGADATGVLLGTFSGTTLPPTFTGSSASGALTFLFTSNGTTNNAGWVANVTCNPPPACQKPTSFAVTNPTINSVNISWGNLGSVTSNEIVAIPCGNPAPTTITTGVAVGSSPIVFSTGLSSATCYDFYIRSVCPGSLISVWTGPISATTLVAPPICGGSFVDDGGITNNYSNGFNNTATPVVICPNVSNPLDKVTVTFTAFDTEATWDGLYVYNGNAVNAINIINSGNPGGNVPGGLLGSYWGTTIPGPFTSTSADGCLTFVFRSDPSVNRPGWLAGITCAPEPTCVKPTGLAVSQQTISSVRLAWTNVSPSTGNQVLALPCGAPLPTSTTTGWVNTTSNPFVLTGLTSGTCYDFYVRSICSPTDTSAQSAVVSSYTLVKPPVCDGNFVDAGGLGIGATFNYPNSSNFTQIICPNNIGVDRVTVTFTQFDTEATWDGLYVYDGNNTNIANLIASNNPPSNVPGGLAGSYWGTTIPGPFTSESADGCLTFVFRSDGSVNRPGWLSNITCSPQPFCKKPTLLNATTSVATAMTLGWTQPANLDGSFANTWKVIALPCGTLAPTSASLGWIVTSSNPHTFPSLSSNTCYEFYVQAVCSNTEISDISNRLKQNTPITCGQNFYDLGGTAADYPSNADSVTTICPTNSGEVVTVTFSAFDIDALSDGLYVFDGSTIISSPLLSENPSGGVPGGVPGAYWGTTIPEPFTASNPTGCLTFRFRSSAFGTGAGWESIVSCAPAPTCARPFQISAVPTSGSAIISWVQPPNFNTTNVANTWQIIVQNATLPPPTPATVGIATTSNPYTAINLNPDTAYTVYIRAVCSNTDSSAWSTPFNFSTYPINDECSGAISAFVNEDLNCEIQTNVKVKGSSLSTQSNGCLTAATGDVWYKFVANSDVQVISVGNANTEAPAPNTQTDKLNFAVYSGSCTNLTEVLCAGTQTTTATTQAGIATNLTAGNTYYVRVFGTATTPPNALYKLCIGKIPCPESTPFCQNSISYQNKTGGKFRDLGRVGCLGTSPNPAFFKLIVQASGPLNYLITQGSQVSGAPEPGFDVDYVAWGPFTDDATACAAVSSLASPINGLGSGGICPDLHACSYSSSETETFCLPNANACDIYIVMVTNFSDDPGYIKFTQENFQVPSAGETTCVPDINFNYPKNAYCKDETVNPIPIVLAPSINGTYEITPAVPAGGFNTATGEINLAICPAGVYIIKSTYSLAIPGGLCAIPAATSVTRTVVLTNPASATIAYNTVTFCNNDLITKPVVLIGTPNGVFSATPNGLAVDPVSGIITPTPSQPGVYQVVYTVPATGGCPAFTSTPVQITVLGIPIINAPNSLNVCLSHTLPTLTGDGKYYPLPNGGGTELLAGTVITSTQTIYVYANNGTCSNQKQFTVTVGAIIAPITNFTYPAFICKNNITNPAPTAASGFRTGGVYSCTDSNLNFVSTSTGVINLSTPPGTYIIKYTITANPAICLLDGSSTYEITILPLNTPQIGFSYTSPVCKDGVNPTPTLSTGFITGGTYSCTDNALVINPTTGVINLSSPAGTYVVNYSLPSSTNISNCYAASSSQATITIKPVITSLSTLSYPSTGCTIGTNLFPTITTAYYSDGVLMSIPPAFAVVNTYSAIPTGLSIDPLTGEINVAASIPGNYVVTKTPSAGTGNCYIGTINTANIDIIAPIAQDLNFSYLTPVCKSSSINPTIITAPSFVTGGLFTSTPPGLILNPATGEINIASPQGTYNVTYTLQANGFACTGGGSVTRQITLLPVIVPSFTQITPICQFTTVPVLPTSSNDVPAITGVWNSAISNTTVGLTTYTFTPNAGQCASTTSMTISVVAPSIIPTFTQIGEICEGSVVTSTLPSVSSNTPAITGSWNPSTITSNVVGDKTYVFTPNAGQCAVPGQMVIKTKPLPVYGISQQCEGSAYTLQIVPNLQGATYNWQSSSDLTPNGDKAVVKVLGNYTCDVIVNGCSKQVIFNVTNVTCTIQKGISPNGDGDNEEFDLSTLDVKQLDIYNRYGATVYSKTSYKKEWVGQSDANQVLPDGTYYYVASLGDGTTKTGWVYINKETK